MWCLRAGLAALAAGQLLPGVWALAGPAHFYGAFPGAGSPWVAADGPFNQHLVVDAGAGLAATGVALGLAAVRPSRQVRLVALVAYLVHALPHLAYHAGHPPAVLGPVEQTLTWAPLAGGVVLAAALLLATLRGPVATALPPPPSGDAGGIPGISGRPRNLLLAAGFAVARRRLGAVPSAWRVTARVPRVALARMAADAAHQRTTLVPARVGALATLRAAMLVGCAFCVDLLSSRATQEGARPEQVADLARWRTSDAYGDDERLALELAEAMTDTPVAVGDGLVAALIDRFGTDGVVELTAAVGHENARARTNRVLGVPPQGFAAAVTCPLPTAART